MDYASARKIADKSGAPKNGPLYDTIGSAATDLSTAESSIRGKIKNIRHILNSVENALDAHPEGDALLNELGELQSRGPDFDLAIAKYCTARQHLSSLMYLAERLHPAE